MEFTGICSSPSPAFAGSLPLFAASTSPSPLVENGSLLVSLLAPPSSSSSPLVLPSPSSAWVPGSAVAAWVPGSAVPAWVPGSAGVPGSARVPGSAMGPGTGTALEATCPVSKSLRPPEHPPPPFDVIRRGTRLLEGGVMSDFVFLCLCFLTLIWSFLFPIIS